MDWIAFLRMVGFCLVSVVLEAVSASKAGRLWFETLQKPRYSFGLRVWYLVGAVYYIIFGIVTYRLFLQDFNLLTLPFLLLFSVMLINGLSNFILFKIRSVRWFYLIVYPFAVVVLALILSLYKNDKVSAALVFMYFVWLIYDLYFLHNLWRMNKAQK